MAFESRGGERDSRGARNVDYNRGLELALQRLGAASATLEDIVIDSRAVADRPLSERQLRIEERDYPLELSSVRDHDRLRKAISRAQTVVGRGPRRRSGAGNPTKRIRMTVTLPEQHPGDASRLVRIIYGYELGPSRRAAPELAVGLPPAWANAIARVRRAMSSPHYMPAMLLGALDLVQHGEAEPADIPFDQAERRFTQVMQANGWPGADMAWQAFYHLGQSAGVCQLRLGIDVAEFTAHPKSRAALLARADRAALAPELTAGLDAHGTEGVIRDAVWSLVRSSDNIEAGKPFDAIAAEAARFRLRRDRPNQGRFRQAVFDRYGAKCAFCDVEVVEMLEAAHIVGKAFAGCDDPRNGLVLCRNHHAAFDAGLIEIDPDDFSVAPQHEFSLDDVAITRATLTDLPAMPAPDALRIRHSRPTAARQPAAP